MALLVGEADDLVLDRRAVARAGGLDLPGVHRRAVEVGADQVVDRLVGVGDLAVHLRLLEASVAKLNGRGSSSPGCSSSFAKSMVRPIAGQGVPVLKRPSSKPQAAGCR